MIADQWIDFYKTLPQTLSLPDEIELLQPYADSDVLTVMEAYYGRYYHDIKYRIPLLGINPGRNGVGVTGVPFTDPVALMQWCGIAHAFPQKRELSSVFVYDMITALGGVEWFTSQFVLSAVCPLGFTRHGKNFNYYDDKRLMLHLESFIVETIGKQIEICKQSKVAVCLGEGKNYKFLKQLNRQYGFFDDILALPHPRYIQQYKKGRREDYFRQYGEVLLRALAICEAE